MQFRMIAFVFALIIAEILTAEILLFLHVRREDSQGQANSSGRGEKEEVDVLCVLDRLKNRHR